MIIALLLMLFIAALGVASGLGHTADTRDPAFALGRITAHHPKAN
jgi:hypothetical protein